MEDLVPTRLLESLPARPPTPPREAQHTTEAFRKQSLLAATRCDALDPRSSLHTPPSAQSLLSSATKAGTTGSLQKRVEFSARAEYKEAPDYAQLVDGQHAHTTPSIVAIPSSNASQPTKSILKATAYEALSPSYPTDISEMLASTVRQLIGASRDSKLDAYLMLARTLKISDNLPDRIALQSKMSLFTQFMQRDITSSKTPEGAIDSTLVVAALELLSTFLRFSAIASTLSNDFAVFIIDHCIRCFEVVSVPRDVLRSLMRVVALQNFPAKVMTSDRVGRLVAALHNMDEQYESKSTIVMRCIIYRALVKNNKMLMTVHLDWLSDLLTDMISTVPHVREAAISLGLEASFALGRERPTIQRVSELLQATDNDERYLDYYAGRLQAMTKNKTDSSSVPQVWSVLTLFLRTLEKWEYLLKWLHILQDCFNSSDYRTKEEANYAWSRFTYALLRHNRILSKKMTTVLNQALVSQLRRRGSGKQADDFRKVVVGCVCNLLYYAMRDVNQLNNVWDNVVKPVVLQLLQPSLAGDSTREKRKVNHQSACAILTGLIDCSTARPWKEDHIAKNPIVAPEDLPSLDVKWLRRNADRVFTLVGPILEENFLELSTPRSTTHNLWHSVVGAVSLAAAKEIKVSPETAAFVGHAFSLILKIWTSGVPLRSNGHSGSISSVDIVCNSPADNVDNAFASTRFLAASREYLLTMVDLLGCLPFTEKQLSKDNRNAFVPAATPSQRAAKDLSVTRTPLRHLIAILWSLPPGIQDNEDYTDFVEMILAPFYSARSSDGRRALAMEIIQMAPADTVCPYGPWKIAASRIASSTLNQTSSGGSAFSGSGSNSAETNRADSMGNHHHYQKLSLSPSAGAGSASPAGHEYREVVRVLERGLRSAPKLPWSCWQSLFHTLCDKVRDDAGEAGLAMCVLEPLAKTIMELLHSPLSSASPSELTTTSSRAALELIALASHSRDRQAFEAAKRRLWGTAIAASGPSAPFDTFDFLYRLTSITLHQSYMAYNPQQLEFVDFVCTLLQEVTGFFSRFHDQLSIKALAASQDGLSDWICDKDSKLSRQSRVFDSTMLAWSGAWVWIERAGSKNHAVTFAMLEPLLCAAFASKHRYIVNDALAKWSHIYGNAGKLDYPEKLKESLSTLQAFVDIPIPGLDNTHVASSEAQQPMFIDSQDGQDAIITLSSAGTNLAEAETPRATPNKQQPMSAQTPLSVTSPSSVNRASHGRITKKLKNEQLNKAKRKLTPPRPRHDDSQIEFAAVNFASALPTCSTDSAKVQTGGNCVGDESQILTERQREVRDCQRKSRALYSDILSSSPTREVAADLPATVPMSVGREPSVPLPQQRLPCVLVCSSLDQEQRTSSPPHEDMNLPEQVRAATPEPEVAEVAIKVKSGETFTQDHFIASTPTPRRGQALVFADAIENEIDSPSSPPEPRRYPLLLDISSKSHSSSSILDEWQFSSSPLSCSPISARHTLPEPELSIDGVLQDSLAGHMAAQAAELASLGDPSTGDNAADLAPAVVSNMLDDNRNQHTVAVMEDTTAPAGNCVTASQESSIASAPPLARKKSKLPATPSTPMQTRRRAALSQESSQILSQESSQDLPQASRQRRNTSSALDSGLSDSLLASAPQSLPRASRRSKRSAASRSVTQSSPPRKSSNHSMRHYKVIAMPSSSMENVSFRMSDGEERSMLRLAAELDALKKETSSQSSPAIKNHGYRSDSYIHPDTDDLGCITVQTRGEVKPIDTRTAPASTPDKMQRTPSQRSRRRKRKRSASTRDAGDEESESMAASSPIERTIAQARRHVSGSKAERFKAAMPTTSPTRSLSPPPSVFVHKPAAEEVFVAYDENDVLLAPEDQEVQSQLALELEVLSQRSTRASNVVDLTAVAGATTTEVVEVVEVHDEIEPDLVSVVEVDEDESSRPSKKPRFAGIMSMLKNSLALLQATSLSRNEVSQIEDVCMDVKRALYDAERRGREE